MVSLFKRNKADAPPADAVAHDADAEDDLVTLDAKQRLITLPVVACGAGLFSDGYINNVSSHPAECPPLIRSSPDSLGHWFRYPHPQPQVRRRLDHVPRQARRQRHCLCRNRRRPTGLRLPGRPVVAHQLATRVDSHPLRVDSPGRRLLLQGRPGRHVQYPDRLALLCMSKKKHPFSAARSFWTQKSAVTNAHRLVLVSAASIPPAVSAAPSPLVKSGAAGAISSSSCTCKTVSPISAAPG